MANKTTPETRLRRGDTARWRDPSDFPGAGIVTVVHTDGDYISVTWPGMEDRAAGRNWHKSRFERSAENAG